MATPITIKVLTKDDKIMEIERDIANRSQTIREMLEKSEDDHSEKPVILDKVDAIVLSKVLEWMIFDRDHEEPPEGYAFDTDREEIRNFKNTYIKSLDHKTLFDIILASNYLHIKNLLKQACAELAFLVKGKSPDDIRKTFSIKTENATS